MRRLIRIQGEYMKHNRLTLLAFIAAFVLLWQIKAWSVFSEKYPNFY